MSGDSPHLEGRPIDQINPSLLWAWIEEDEEINSIIAARLVPAEFFHSDEEICLARELLTRYGHREEVQDALSSNYRTESWTGPESKHYTQKKEQLEDFKEDESNEHVLRWVDTQITSLEERIEQAKKYEERLGFDVE